MILEYICNRSNHPFSILLFQEEERDLLSKNESHVAMPPQPLRVTFFVVINQTIAPCLGSYNCVAYQLETRNPTNFLPGVSL